jgi:GNAT superfamily N-acetyltransferase
MLEYIVVNTESEYQAAAKLFVEYALWLNIDLSFQHFDQELIHIKEMYAPPAGTIILCKNENDFIASVAVRPINKEIAEFKRMFVKTAFHRNGIGQSLLDLAFDFTKKSGYKKIRLDTLDNMIPAMSLYQKNGFYTIPAYYFNPEPNAVYFEKEV